MQMDMEQTVSDLYEKFYLKVFECSYFGIWYFP